VSPRDAPTLEVNVFVKDLAEKHVDALSLLQVVVGNDEPQDSAMKRFRREVMTTGLVQEVRRGASPARNNVLARGFSYNFSGMKN